MRKNAGISVEKLLIIILDLISQKCFGNCICDEPAIKGNNKPYNRDSLENLSII